MTSEANSKMLSLEQAQAAILDSISPVAEQLTLPLPESLGRVLAQVATAKVDVPGHDNSAMDGFALRAADARGEKNTLRCVGDSFAGHPFNGRLEAGQCVRIMTGGVVPDGADSVVMQERCQRDEDSITIERPVPLADNIRRAGEDFARGDQALDAGHHLRPADMGVLASIGVAEVSVYRKPKIAFFSTGDELQGLGQALAPGQIYDSNRYSIRAMVEDMGLDFVDYGVVEDQPQALREAFEQAGLECDAIVTSGGVSVGAADYVVDVLREVGEVGFWKVNVKPGKPFAFGHIGKAAFFGLPGNPVSVIVGFGQYVRPALVKLAGGRPAPAMRFMAVTQSDIRKRPGRMEFQRARLLPDTAGAARVQPFGHQGSGVLRSVSQADCYIVLPPESADIAAGESVVVEPFSQAIWG